MAERLIYVELARALSPSVRGVGGSTELAIGTLGIAQGNEATVKLIDLIGLRLDGAAAEERTCQILIRGSALLLRLERINPREVSKRCGLNFQQARRQELFEITDVTTKDICRTPAEISISAKQLANAIRAHVSCDLE